MQINKYNLILKDHNMMSRNVKLMSFVNETSEKINFVPGQFITILLNINGTIKNRSYSIASIPNKNNTINIAVSYITDGIGSNALFNLKIGDKISILGPVGKFVINLNNIDKNINRFILVGTGTGIIPYYSMLDILEQLLKKSISIDLLFGVQTKKDLLYEKEFIEISKKYNNFNLRVCFSQENNNTNENYLSYSSYVQDIFENLNLNINNDIIYLCGNPDMIHMSYKKLIIKGFSSKQIHREKYTSSN